MENSEESKNKISKFLRTANFYMLPKMHMKNTPGRPIVNSIGSIMEKISAYIDEKIKPLVPLIPSYVSDTTHFINQIFGDEIENRRSTSDNRCNITIHQHTQ